MSAHDMHPDDDHLAERGRALVRDAVAGVAAPHALRERIEAERTRTRPARRRRRLALGGSLAGVAAAALLAVVLASPGSGPGAPSVADAAVLTARAATAPAPAVEAGHADMLRRTFAGVTYPAWSDHFGLRATGQRADRVGGRRAVTVFYETAGGPRLGYTIVGGGALDEPSGHAAVRGDERYVVLRRGGRIVVTWRRGGHTCVLGAPATVSAQRMVDLASWSGYDHA